VQSGEHAFATLAYSVLGQADNIDAWQTAPEIDLDADEIRIDTEHGPADYRCKHSTSDQHAEAG
jgi:hypothetical protein